MILIEAKENYEFILFALTNGPPPPLMKQVCKEGEEASRLVKKHVSGMTAYERGCIEGEKWAKRYLVQALSNSIYTAIDSYKDTAKGMWDQVAKMMRVSAVEKQLKINSAITKFDNFNSAKENL